MGSNELALQIPKKPKEALTLGGYFVSRVLFHGSLDSFQALDLL